MRTAYIGPFNNHVKDQLFERAIHSLRKGQGHKFYYLLPNGELLSEYRRRIIEKIGRAFEINLFTFDDIVDDILRGRLIFTIDDSMKELIIERVIGDLDAEGKIKYYKDIARTEGFVEEVNYIIGEIKRSLIYPSQYLNKCPKKASYLELGLIYSEYENTLENLDLYDREEAYFKALDLLSGGLDIFEEIDFVIIDEFYDFRPIEIEILRKMCDGNLDIFINIPFQMNWETSGLEDTIDLLKELNFEIKYIGKKSEDLFTSLGTNFLGQLLPQFQADENIGLVKSPTIYLELKKVFELIKKENLGGRRLRDMAIVLMSEEYKSHLFQVAKEEGVPIDMRMELPLIQVPLVREFLNTIEMSVSRGDKQSFIKRLKSYYFDTVPIDNRDGLEYVIRRLDFRNLSELESLLAGSKSLNINMEYLEILVEVVKTCIEEQRKICREDLVSNYNEIFGKLIEDYRLVEKINSNYQSHGDFDLYYRDISAIEKLTQVMEKMGALSFVVKKLSLEEYFRAFIRKIEKESILKMDGNIEGVKLLNPINSRGLAHDIIFITGLSSNFYPNIRESNFLINDANYLDLKAMGLDYKNYQGRLNNEAIKFASILSSTKDKLYLSYCQGTEEDSIASIFLDELLSMLRAGGIDVETIELDLSYELKDRHAITTMNELSNYLILNYDGLSDGEMENYLVYHNLYFEDKFKNINKKSLCEYERSKPNFNEYSGLITREDINRDLSLMHHGKIFSASYLEDYSRCPYYFLLSRALNVEEMERAFQDYSPIDIGSLYHEALRSYYSYYKDDIWNYVKGLGQLNLEDSFNYLRDVLEKHAKELGFNLEDRLSGLTIDNVFTRLRDFIKTDMDRIAGSEERLLPYAFELDFGTYGDFSINIGDKELKFRGSIDRIDKISGEDKYVILDYKSSPYGVYDIEQMRSGLSLQLPIYLLSQQDKKIVGGLYAIISNQKFEFKLGLLGETSHVSKRLKGAISQEELDSLMLELKGHLKRMVESISEGDFSVNPLDCSPYCIYRDICRYENVLEVE